MPSTRDLLGDEVISKLTEQGLTPGQIRAMAKSAYELQKEEQTQANEQRLSDAQTMDNSFIRQGANFLKSRLESNIGYAKFGEDIVKGKPTEYAKNLEKDNIALDNMSTLPSNFTTPTFGKDQAGNPTIDTTPKLKTDYEYSNFTKGMQKMYHRLETYDKNYKSTIGDKWDIAGTAGGFQSFS